ncbi:hypothetical protein EA58_16815 [Photobacterium galatheae]|uniref:Uncharacterized protein n=1 Tax=Photobacterium galatheae TaxID=1654360 RepID=A0A066RJ83_9GAMM|nr:hypothetical protein EA58_16815 [Photobacterium galatheae]
MIPHSVANLSSDAGLAYPKHTNHAHRFTLNVTKFVNVQARKHSAGLEYENPSVSAYTGCSGTDASHRESALKAQFIYLLSTLWLTGCGLQLHHDRPDYLTEHARYTIQEQSDASGRYIRFADFQGEVRKSWVNHNEDDAVPDDRRQRRNTQDVALQLSGMTGTLASMNYRQACFQKQSTFGMGNSSSVDDSALLSGEAQVKQQVWDVQSTTLLENEEKGDAIEVGGNRVRFNERVIAEYHFSSGQPMVNRDDYVWLDESQPDEIRALAALMVLYAMTYEAVFCVLN